MPTPVPGSWMVQTSAGLLTDGIGLIGDANMWPIIGAVAIVALAGFLFRKFGGKTR